MKLILTQEVAGLGVAGDVVEVKDGYGRNYLVPRGYAIAWTKGGEKQVATIKRARDAREIRDLGHAQEIKRDLENADRHAAGPRRRRRPAVRLGHRGRRRRGGAEGRRPARWTGGGSSWPAASSRSAGTRCRSCCTPR